MNIENFTTPSHPEGCPLLFIVEIQRLERENALLQAANSDTARIAAERYELLVMLNECDLFLAGLEDHTHGDNHAITKLRGKIQEVLK